MSFDFLKLPSPDVELDDGSGLYHEWRTIGMGETRGFGIVLQVWPDGRWRGYAGLTGAPASTLKEMIGIQGIEIPAWGEKQDARSISLRGQPWPSHEVLAFFCGRGDLVVHLTTNGKFHR